MQETMRLEKYFPASEITVLAVCFVMVILLIVSFKVRMKSFRIFAGMLWMLITATFADLMLHYLMDKDPALPTWIFYSLRSIYHILLFALLHSYAAYTCEATALSRLKRRPYVVAATVLFVAFSVADTVGIFTGKTMHIIDGAISFEGSQIFTAGYICFVVLLAALLYRVRRRLYKQVMLGFFCVAVLSIGMLAVARLRTQSSYTAATFLFPLIAVMYLLHSNPYDAMLGANDLRGLNNLIRYSDEKQREYLYLSLYMKELDESGSTMSDELKTLIRHVAEAYYRRSALFQVSNGHMLLMVPKDRNRHWQERTEKILQEFGLEGPHSHIINGHVPVKAKKGESPLKAGGKLIVIDGGFCKAYQSTSGIAGYTLIYTSYSFRIVAHQPFVGRKRAIAENFDISSSTNVFEPLESRQKIKETDTGRELQKQIDDLLLLLDAFHDGVVAEDHKSK